MSRSTELRQHPHAPCVSCPLCETNWIDPHATVGDRNYFRCARCWLVFLEPTQRLPAEAEAAHYRLHRNEVDDPAYRCFVSPLVEALLARIPPGSAGLDFGCGPGPVVASMLEEAGHGVRRFDPQFQPDLDALSGNYDFIVLSEVAEHLHAPAAEFARLRGLLKAGGLIAVMTGFVPGPSRFVHWHYLRDPTHVVFYAPSTFRWLARRLDLRCELPGANLALLCDPG